MRTYNASAKFLATVTDDFTDSCGTARGMVNEMHTLKVRLEADRTVTAVWMNHETMTITKVPNARTADVRSLYAQILAA